ncbi:hypothetical protein [Zobellia russellii]|uniref:hypothetical protein n=1 Tax=Zobellia russellii TaxID=248907 RepID=UPI0037DBFB80
MKKDTIINLLSELEPNSGEVKKISYKGKPLERPVVEIPLEYLTYNKYNGRIKAITLSYEKEFGEIDPIKNKDLIISFLWNSAEARNKQTKESIEHFGQNEPGIVTKDGIIIDGNRRASIISKINEGIKEDEDKIKFRAIILPDELEDSKKDIIYLETVYQIGVDSKVDYDPIEKYLRCKELVLLGFDHSEIADMMAVKEQRIIEWLEILGLMEDYLMNYGYDKLYTRLDKREGYFVDLFKYLKVYNGVYGKDIVDWSYSPKDILDLKNTYFDYIRMRIPVSQAREIGRTSNAKSFFTYEKLWKDFLNSHKAIVNKYEEPLIKDLKKENPDASFSELAWKKDQKWITELKSSSDEILNYYGKKLYEKKKSDKPLEILRSISYSLENLNTQSLDEPNREVFLVLLGKISRQIDELGK